jgi:hypothetical protein
LAQASGSTFLELPAGQTPGLKAPGSMLMRLGRTSGDSVEVWTHDDFAEVGAAGEEILACPQEVLHDAGRTPHGIEVFADRQGGPQRSQERWNGGTQGLGCLLVAIACFVSLPRVGGWSDPDRMRESLRCRSRQLHEAGISARISVR